MVTHCKQHSQWSFQMFRLVSKFSLARHWVSLSYLSCVLNFWHLQNTFCPKIARVIENIPQTCLETLGSLLLFPQSCVVRHFLHSWQSLTFNWPDVFANVYFLTIVCPPTITAPWDTTFQKGSWYRSGVVGVDVGALQNFKIFSCLLLMGGESYKNI